MASSGCTLRLRPGGRWLRHLRAGQHQGGAPIPGKRGDFCGSVIGADAALITGAEEKVHAKGRLLFFFFFELVPLFARLRNARGGIWECIPERSTQAVAYVYGPMEAIGMGRS